MFPVYDITRRRSPATPHRNSVSRRALQQSQIPLGTERPERRLSSPLKPPSRRMSTLCRATEAVTQRPTIHSTDPATPRVQAVCRKTFTPEVAQWSSAPITTCISRKTFAPRPTASLAAEMDNSPRRRPDHDAKTHRKVYAGTVDPRRSRDQRTAATVAPIAARGAVNPRQAEVHLTKHTRQQTTQPIRRHDRQPSRKHSHQHHRQQSQHSHQHFRQHSRQHDQQLDRQHDRQSRQLDRLPSRPLERLPLRRVSTCSAAFSRNSGVPAASIADRRTCRTSEQIKERKKLRLREKETATIRIQRCFRWRFRMKESLRRITNLTAAVRRIQRWWRRKRLQWKVHVTDIISHDLLILDLLRVPKLGGSEVSEPEKEPLQLEQSPLLVPRMRLRSVKFENASGLQADLSSARERKDMYSGTCHSERRLQE